MGPHSSECGNTVPPDSHGLVAEASMGPHSSECGNMPRSCSSDAAVSLQWGRTHLSAETLQSVPRILSRHTASMGPHSSECGNNLNRTKNHFAPGSLQWGRTHLSAETPLAAWLDRLGQGWLQWGRTHLSAETCNVTATPICRLVAS